MKKLTHIDEKGRPKMVDVGSKPLTERMAVARGSVCMKKETFKLISIFRRKAGNQGKSRHSFNEIKPIYKNNGFK